MHKATPTSVNEPLSEKQLNGVVEIIARPNRSASPATMLGVFAALAFSVLMVSLFSYLQGNVWAPLFALADLALVAVCFRWVWRRGEDYDCIRMDSEQIAIESRRGPRHVRSVTRPDGPGSGRSSIDAAMAAMSLSVHTAGARKWEAF